MKTNLKHLLTQTLILIASVFSLFSCLAATNGKSAQKEIRKQFSVTEATRFIAYSKYGNLTIAYGQDDFVIVDAKIEAKASSEKQAKKMLDNLDVVMDATPGKVSIKTVIDNGNDWGRQREFSIDIHVTLPARMQAELNQKYGTITMPGDNRGKYQIDMKYSKLTAGNFTQPLNVEAGYSKLKLGNLKQVSLELSYCSDVLLNNVEIASIECKYSDLSFRRLDNLLSKADLSYSSLDIDEVSVGFQDINIDARYSKVNIRVAPKTPFTLIAENTRYSKCLLLSDFLSNNVRKNGKSYEYAEVNGAHSGKINFSGASYSTLIIK